MKIKSQEVKKFIIQILTKENCPLNSASITAEVLLEGDLKGYPNHGINRLSQILEGVKNKTINLKAKPKILKESSSFIVIDGDYGLGYPLGKRGMELAIKKARQNGVGITGVINSSHLGIMGYYSEIASEQGFVGISMTTSSPAVVLCGGKIKTLGTNPFSYSVPYKKFPLTADFSTAKIPRASVYEHLENNTKLPNNCAVDKNGNSTRDPRKALEGGLVVFGDEKKGLFFSLLISILTGPLIGGVINPKVTGTRYMNKKPNKGDLFIAIDINKSTKKDLFDYKISELVNFIRKQNIDFRIPNERSYKERKKRIKEGVEIPEKTIKIFKNYDLI